MVYLGILGIRQLTEFIRKLQGFLMELNSL